MPGNAFDRLSDQAASGALRLIHLVAPPRSASTALERALSNSPDVTAQINDPWSIYDDNREEQTYEFIAGRVSALKPPRGRVLTVVVKDIADYIPPGDPWTRMTQLSQQTIFLVRQPLLALESLLRMMAKAVARELGEDHARRSGFASWAEAQREMVATRDYRRFDELFAVAFAADQPLHEAAEMQVPVLVASPLRLVRNLGYPTHDAYALSKGRATWSDLCTEITAESAVPSDCADLVAENLTRRIAGWDAFDQHLSAMGAADSHVLVDATLYRALPALFLERTLTRLGLRYAAHTVEWGSDGRPFTSDYDGDVPYYDRVVASTGVLAPTESPLQLERLPPFLQSALPGPGGWFDIYRRSLATLARDLPPAVRSAVAAARVAGRPIEEVDPVFWAIWTSVVSPETTLDLLEASESRHPAHASSFAALRALLGDAEGSVR